MGQRSGRRKPVRFCHNRAMKRQLLAIVTALGLSLPTLSIAAAVSSPSAITHEDLWLMKRVGSPSVSPDGRWAVFAVTEPAYDEKAQVSDLWIVATAADRDGRLPAPRRLTGTAGGESGVDWSEDSRRLVFSARREGDESAQLYLLDLSGGEAIRLTQLVNGAGAEVFPGWKVDCFRQHPISRSQERGRQSADRRRAQGAQMERACLRRFPDPQLGSVARRFKTRVAHPRAASGQCRCRRAT